MKDYKLMNVATGRIFEDQGWTLDDPEGKTPSMVRAIYEHKQLRVSDDERLVLGAGAGALQMCLVRLERFLCWW